MLIYTTNNLRRLVFLFLFSSLLFSPTIFYSQSYTLDGNLEVTQGTTVGGAFRLSGSALSDDLGYRLLFLDDDGKVTTITDSVLEDFRYLIYEQPPMALDCEGPMITHPNPSWVSGPGKIIFNSSACYYTPRLGLGTSNPETLLDVYGKARIGDAEVNSEALFTLGNTSTDIINTTGLAISQGNTSLQNNAMTGVDIKMHSNNEDNVGTRINLVSGTGYIIDGQSSGETVFLVTQSGHVWATEINVRLAEDFPFPDYVFYPDYDLMTLEELKNYIEKYGHLPELPTYKEVADNGINIGELNALLVKKIEELTLYIIEAHEEIKLLKTQQLK